MEKPLINILIRTSRRPNYFNRCIESIRSQTYTNYRIIVSVDTPGSFAYACKHDVQIVQVKRLSKKSALHAPYNLYNNELLQHAKRGWIMFLDDDKMFSRNNALSIIAGSIISTREMLIWRVKLGTGRLVPATKFMSRFPARNQIDSSCACFHSKYRDKHKWDDQRAGDYRFLALMYRRIPHHAWIDEVLVKTDNNGLKGQPLDLKIKKK